VEQAFSGKTLSNLDRAFATAIGYGTITHVVVIDAILSAYSSMPLDKVEPLIRTILRTGTWQIFWSEKVPDSAACNESVQLAKKVSNKGAASYVNGLLRTLVREKQSIQKTFILDPKEFYLRCSLPRELAGYFRKWFGETRSVSICDALNTPSPSTARVNTIRTGDEELRRELEMNGCATSDPIFMEHAFSIRTNGVLIESLTAFQNGEFIIQDEGAMLVTSIADPKPGQSVVDLCSAPGGKTCHMAERMENKGKITACDINPSRLSLVKENADRLGFSMIEYRQMDACDPLPPGLPLADIVLADVPCSGLGVLGKKPDIRVHMTHEKMNALYPVQRRILENAATMVKPGGFLIYSTCTVNPAENQEQIQQFIDSQGNHFETIDISDRLPEKLIQLDPALLETATQGMVALFPDQHHCDGFFIAKLRRK